MLNIAVIGLGQMGTHHARIYASLPGVKLSAVCEADQDRREAACRAETDIIQKQIPYRNRYHKRIVGKPMKKHTGKQRREYPLFF